MRNCKLCGAEYDFCPQCALKSEPGWRVWYDKRECSEVADILSYYICGLRSAFETYKMLQPYSLKNKKLEQKFDSAYKEIMQQISVQE